MKLLRSIFVLGFAATVCRADGPTTQPAATLPDLVTRLETVFRGQFESDHRTTIGVVGELTSPATTRPAALPAEQLITCELPQQAAIWSKRVKEFGVAPRVRMLPEESRVPDRFGIVIPEHAIQRQGVEDKPGHKDNVSDLTKGEAVFIMDRDESGKALFVHSSDGYLGWVDASAIRPIGADAMRRALNDGRSAEAAKTAQQIIDDAKQFMGTDYVWGGKTKDGIDCSGLMQVSFGKHGILLPRDADQQAAVGRLVATRYFTDALLPGDLLFFMHERGGNVGHVGMYIGDGRYVEGASPRTRITSLRSADPEYDGDRAGTLVWARRVIE